LSGGVANQRAPLAEHHLAQSLSASRAEAAPQLRSNPYFLALEEELHASEKSHCLCAAARQRRRHALHRYKRQIGLL
jgi:hypothetical protein